MAEPMLLTAMSSDHQALVRQAARRRERITIVDDQGEPSAVVVSADDLEDLEDALAVAQSRLREVRGKTEWVAHEDVRHGLDLDR